MSAVEPYWASEDGDVVLYLGDCRDVLPSLPENSVDAVVCDPPYDLTSGKKGGSGPASLNEKHPAGRSRVTTGGFMGATWDATGVAFDPATWRAVMRVMKPGAYLLAFGGTRTWHRLVCAIEDAGFEIRDPIADLTGMDGPGLLWIQGQGYPKNLDVAKAIDKVGGISPEVQGAVLRAARERAGLTRAEVAEIVRCKEASIQNWEDGRARAAGRAVEYITPSPEYRDALADLLGYTADERRITGASADRRGDGTVIGLGHSGVLYATDGATEPAKRWEGWGTALKPAWEPIVVARKLLDGTVAANVLKYGTGAFNLAACKVGTESRVNNAGGASSLQRVSRVEQGYRPTVTTSSNEDAEVEGRWPPNLVLGEEAAAELDRQSGVLTSGANPARRGSDKFRDAYGDFAGQPECVVHRGVDSGGASRFFPVFKYEPKAPPHERPRLPDGTAWPTVKPLDLMRWLARLVTPPGGMVLDPFSGSGTTGEACVIEGFRCILIDQDPKAADLTVTRLSKPIQPAMLTVDDSAPAAPVRPVAASRPKPAPGAYPSLFDDMDEASLPHRLPPLPLNTGAGA